MTKNLCISHGLVNGTTAIVHDIVCDAKGEPLAVLLVVTRRTPTTDGYSGESFLTKATDVDMATHAVISVGRNTQSVSDGGKSHTRTQFPLMLAWAVTVRAS